MQSADRVAQDLKELNIKVCFEAVMYKTLEPTVLSSHPPMAIRLFPRTAALPKSEHCANKDVPEQIFRDACATALIGKKDCVVQRNKQIVRDLCHPFLIVVAAGNIQLPPDCEMLCPIPNR